MSTLYIPAGSITNTELATNAAIAASKAVHHFAKHYGQDNGADVASKTHLLHAAKTAGVLAAVEVAVSTAPTGGDKKFTVDVQKSTGGGAFATMLSAVVTIDSGKSNFSVTAGTISGASYAAGDILEVIVTASGSTGSQGQGLSVDAYLQEATS
jgi:hypothetical protein